MKNTNIKGGNDLKNGIKTLAVWLIIGVILIVGVTAIYDNSDRKFTYSELVSKLTQDRFQLLILMQMDILQW